MIRGRVSITSVALAVAPGLGFQLPVNRSNPSCWVSPEHDVDGIAEAAEVEVEVREIRPGAEEANQGHRGSVEVHDVQGPAGQYGKETSVR